VTATVTATPAAPTGTASQSFCSGTSPTVGNLTATGLAIQWYTASSGGSLLAPSTALVNGTHYYASQTVSGCESILRFDVTATVTATPAAPTGTAGQSFCSGTSPTVGNLTATGLAIQWYTASSGGSLLAPSTALVNGTHYYASQTVSGCESILRFDVTATVTSCFKTLNLNSVMLEGLYNGGGTMRKAFDGSGSPHWSDGSADHITVELHSATSYADIVFTATDVPLSTNGTASVTTIPASLNGSYYITIRHRNSIETTTAVTIPFAGSIISQSFGNPGFIYGGNLGMSFDSHYMIYGGDVNQDGAVDSGDYPSVVNDNFNYVSGYLGTDIDGNGSIDSGDYPIMVNNNFNYIGTAHP
jgi:hypothetical protein